MQAISQGFVTPREIDASVRRLLRPMFQLGLFDPPEAQPAFASYNWSQVATQAHRQLAIEGARQSLVLLQARSDAECRGVPLSAFVPFSLSVV